MYFSKFPVLRYPVKSGDTFRLSLARNLLRRVGLSDGLKSVDAAFVKYDVLDGERPEHIADKLYGDPELHWLVLLANEIIDPYHDWYKSDAAMEEYLGKKYRFNSVHFTSLNEDFLYSTHFFSGCTLVQGSISAPVAEYDPRLCKFGVESVGFQEGVATVFAPSGNSYPVQIHRIDSVYSSLHHFYVESGVVDPLSQQTGTYSYVGGVIGSIADEYPDPNTTNGINYLSGGGITLDFWQTYIGRYMGVSGEKVGTYAVSKRLYEFDENNKKRTIKLLHPRFKGLALEELDALLRV